MLAGRDLASLEKLKTRLEMGRGRRFEMTISGHVLDRLLSFRLVPRFDGDEQRALRETSS